MKNSHYLLFIALFVLSSCATHNSDPKLSPTKFEVSNGGNFGPAYMVVLKGDHLTYTRAKLCFRWGLNHNIKPTDKQWVSFWHEMDRIHLWEWKRQYKIKTTIYDGSQWSVAISKGSRTIECHGDNAYPADDSPKKTSGPGGSKRFDAFTEALTALIGRHDLN